MSTAVGEAREATRPDVAARVVLAVRLLLVALLVLVVAHRLRSPDDRPVEDLLAGLARGSVHSVTVVGGPDRVVDSGSGLGARWTDGSARSHISRYAVAPGQADPVLDAFRRSPDRPHLTYTQDPDLDPRTRGTQWSSRLLAVPLLALLLLGAEPRRATRWAWFWAGAVLPLTWPAYLLLEPAPPWRARPPGHRRGTGGWALLGAVVVAWGLSALLPLDLARALWVRYG